MAKDVSSRVGMKSVVQHLPDEVLGLTLSSAKRKRKKIILFLITVLLRHISPSQQFAHLECSIQ